ncbi:hypothetical protein AURDEDRAFT_123123 [Auricularia subglabra TFB-10046 SS5]|nr:hypothetical protein AURDEDRAFT_123123 [Auricularia subglabra TFB-10046 SS5]
MKSVTLVLTAASLSSVARAHGTLALFVADGVSYVGPKSVDVSPPPVSFTPIRQISTLEPITDPTSAAIVCGPKAAPSAPTVAPVTAGSQMSFLYRAGTDSTVWPHNVGPLMTYLYKCPSGTSADKCAPPPSGTPGWFKISELGRKSGGDWWQADLKANKSVPVTLPAEVPSGDYLLRFEVLALQNAMSAGLAEFYVSCTQIRVSGTATQDAQAQGAQLVAFPGAYSPSDPGILVNVYDNAQYVFPGPPVFGSSDVTAGAPGNSDAPGGSGAGAPGPAAAAKPVPKCKLRATRPQSVLQGRQVHSKGQPAPRRVRLRSSRNH